VSGYQPIGGEVLYASCLAATASVPTAAAVTITAGMPPIVIPAKYFKNVGDWSSSLQFLMGGLMTATATIPTWNFGLYAAIATTSAPAFSTGSVTLGTTGTFTPPGAVTNVPWELEVQIGLRALALGAASTIVTWGGFRGAGFNAAGYVPVPGSGAYTPPATWDTTQAYVLWPGLTLGAATAGNTVTVEYAKLYGEN
jgi:hypothetical protein